MNKRIIIILTLLLLMILGTGCTKQNTDSANSSGEIGIEQSSDFTENYVVEVQEDESVEIK